VSSQPFDAKVPTASAGAKIPGWKDGVVKAVYLAAIGLATIGWLWLIVWIARQMI
jgi:hypothetical protein